MDIGLNDLLSKEGAQLYLSRDRSVYIGCVGDLMHISKAPAVYIVSLGGELALLDSEGGQQARMRSIVLPADSKVTLKTSQATVAICFLDFLGNDLEIFKACAANCLTIAGKSVLLEPSCQEQFSHLLVESYLSKTSCKVIFRRIESLLTLIAEEMGVSRNRHVDPRIISAIDYIRTSKGLSANVDVIAEFVSLSVPRFTQLFRLTTGIPLRRFKIWYRMYLASVKLAEGKSFTEAAVAAGFSDYAHFSRSFTEMGGVAPSVMLYGNQDLHLDVLKQTGSVLQENGAVQKCNDEATQPEPFV